MSSDGVSREAGFAAPRRARSPGGWGRKDMTEIAGGVVKILFRPKLPGFRFLSLTPSFLGYRYNMAVKCVWEILDGSSSTMILCGYSSEKCK